MLARVARAAATPALRTACRPIKTSTGIVGLEVQPDARAILTDLYAKTLSALETVPSNSAYRLSVTEMTNKRLAAVKATEDLEAIEAAIGAGQVEEVIKQAEDELALIPVLVDADVFAPYAGAPPSEIYADLKRRGVALQRHDIPMRQSQDYPIADSVELISPPDETEEKK